MVTLEFTTDTMVQAAGFVNDMVQEGQNNHDVAEVTFELIEQHKSGARGHARFDRADSNDLRIWVEQHAKGVGGVHIVRYSTANRATA